MNWKLILMLSLFGVLMGVASLFGWTRGIEPLLWFIIFILYAWWIPKNCPRLHFFHGFLASVLNGIWIGILQAAFYSTYTNHNPEILERFKSLPPGVNQRILMLVIGLISGILFGLVAGLFAFIGGKLLRKATPVERE
jgi:hypothetical protein